MVVEAIAGCFPRSTRGRLPNGDVHSHYGAVGNRICANRSAYGILGRMLQARPRLVLRYKQLSQLDANYELTIIMTNGETAQIRRVVLTRCCGPPRCH